MQPGDKVVFIEETFDAIGLIHGDTYTVNDTLNCGCRHDPVNIDVGIRVPGFHAFCCDCGTNLVRGEQLFFPGEWFRKLDDITTADELINQAIAKKPEVAIIGNDCGPEYGAPPRRKLHECEVIGRGMENLKHIEHFNDPMDDPMFWREWERRMFPDFDIDHGRTIRHKP